MIIFKEERLSLPYVRVIFTKHANPNLASHAPNDRISNGVSASVCDCIDSNMEDSTNNPRIIASRFNRHRRKFFRFKARAIEGIMIISGSIIFIMGRIIKGDTMVGL